MDELSRLTETPRGPGRVPWGEGENASWPLSGVAGQESGLIAIQGWTSAISVLFNPNGNAMPVGGYELRIYARVQSVRYLAAKLTLTSGDTQTLRARYPAQSWEVAVGMLTNISVPSWNGQSPTVEAIAHGRE